MVKRMISREKIGTWNQKTRLARLLHFWPLFVIILFTSVLFLTNLGNHYLWQDEAETALVGRTILEHGVPLGYDGKNYFSQSGEADYGENYVWKRHSWLQFYTVAASFALLGTNTLAARLPFALLGIAAVLIVYFLTQEMFKSRPTSTIAAGLLATSIPFMLLSRQCRYFSLSAFFFLLALWVYLRFIRDKKYSFAGLVVTLALLFQSFYPASFILIASTGLHAGVFFRKKLPKLLGAFSIAAAICLPSLLWHASAASRSKADPFDLSRIVSYCSVYLRDIDSFLFPWWLLAVGALAAAFCYLERGEWKSDFKVHTPQVVLLFLLIIGTLIFFSLWITELPFFRYLTTVIPLFCILSSLIVVLSARVHIIIAAVVLVCVVSLQPWNQFLYELTHDYNGPVKGIAKYLQAHGKDSDTVLITYDDLPLKFYTKMRVFGGLTGELLDGAEKADWVIVRKYRVSSKEMPVRRFILANISLDDYERIIIHCPDIPYENRESPREHLFKTAENKDPVVIYKRKHK